VGSNPTPAAVRIHSRSSAAASVVRPYASSVRVERHETEEARWEVARREPPAELRPYLLGSPEGWTQVRGQPNSLREAPFPGVPFIINLGTPWEIEDPGTGAEQRDSFVAGLHAAPTIVRAASCWSCIELRLTPLGAHRFLGLPMHELANRTVELEDLLPRVGELTTRLRETHSWVERFDLVEGFLARRLANSVPSSPGVEWSWHRLRSTGGGAPISELATELGWSHRRLIARFREQIGLAPKTVARVLRFDRAVAALGSPTSRGLAEIALDCGYFDQAHLNRDFRELAGTTPTVFLRSQLDSGGIAA
jgi:AraC-like DNA-binding protein